MYRQIARLHDAGQHAPHVAVHREPEAWLMQQGLQVVLVGHRDGLVCRIYPLHRQLQRLPAPHRAHRRGGGEHFLGLDGRISEEGIFGAGGEIGEVGHKNHAPYEIKSDTHFINSFQSIFFISNRIVIISVIIAIHSAYLAIL